MFKPFEDTLTLIVSITALILCGFFLSIMFVSEPESLSSKIITIATFASGLGTILAVFVAWKAKNQWFNQKHYEQKNHYFSIILELYKSGLNNLEFAVAVELCQKQKTNNKEEIKYFIKQAHLNYKEFDILYQKALRTAFELEVNQSQYHGKIMHNLINNFKPYAKIMSSIDFHYQNQRDLEMVYHQFNISTRSEITRLADLLFEYRFSTEFFINVESFGMNPSASKIESFLDMHIYENNQN
ncbi:hypothetical protein [Aliivibrio fischeri]|uniref:hypothetical protein n=1 Tax=Aliivibrio fischeri TaxID=668 RepID=UPI00080E32CB|nr:hypothetical protein [Aliivibrio fischeri]OCH10557.1 hypothetical protein A6E09_11430 [Aliivibrio fischeri]